MKLKKIFILLINFLLLISISISSNIELLTFSANITGENFYSENPFSGGYNKPKIQWIDWNNDGFDELFLLEINTQPGLTQNSLLPEMAKSNGTDFLELCEILLSNAECEVL